MYIIRYLSRSCVGKHELAVGVTNAVYVRDDGASLLVEHSHVVIHLHEAALRLNAGSVKAEAVGVGHTASSYETGIDFKGFYVLLGLGVDHLDGDGLDPGDAGGDLGAESGVDVGELKADVTRADDSNILRGE